MNQKKKKKKQTGVYSMIFILELTRELFKTRDKADN